MDTRFPNFTNTAGHNRPMPPYPMQQWGFPSQYMPAYPMQQWGFPPQHMPVPMHYPQFPGFPSHGRPTDTRPAHGRPAHGRPTDARPEDTRPKHTRSGPVPRKNTGQKFSVENSHRSDILRPFAHACKTAFVHLRKHIDSSIEHLSPEKKFIIVRGLDCKDKYDFVSSDGRPQEWALHTVLYGKMSESFTERENTHHQYGIISPFVALQMFYKRKGFFVTNESDPVKGHKLIIIVRRVQQDAERLWHGQNLMPEDSDINIATMTNFYLASIVDAVKFIDTVFASRAAAAAASTDDKEEDKDGDGDGDGDVVNKV
jgi:hypothetical protein